MSSNTFIIFDRQNNSEINVTDRKGYILGVIRKYNKWNKNCFFPAANTLFDEKCLIAIANFCLVEDRK